jgi:WD40 repeat protein
VAISPDRTLVVVGCADSVCLCNTGTGEIIQKQEVGQEVGLVSSATFSPDGTMIGFSTGATVWLWKWKHNAPRPFYGDSGPIRALAFAENGRRFVTAGSDTVTGWDISDGAVLRWARANVGGVNALAVSPEGKRVASAGADRSVKVWSVQDGHLLEKFDVPIARISAMAFSPGGGDIALAGGNTLAIYNLAGGNSIKASSNTGPLQSTVFATGGRVLAAGAKDNAITIWNLDESKLLAAPTVPRGW